MTPQEKQVFGKLFAKTELGTHNVELALTDDFKSIFDKSNSEQESIGQNLIKALSKAETDYKQNLQNLQNGKKIGDDLISKAKDLGIDLPANITNQYKTIDVMIKENQTYLSKISQMYSIF
jgi:hypothetical protein